MRYREIIQESLEDWNTGRWVHYSDHEMMTINLKPFHQDPLGIYFFPESFKPGTSMWATKKYKFTVALAPDARILDYSQTTDEQLAAMLDATKATAVFEEQITRYPPEDRRRKLDMAWECMRHSMILGEGGGKARWNKVLRALGWDAIFDDTGSIHASEVQLLVLNPRIIRSVEMTASKFDAFAAMRKVVADLKAVCEPYGEVEVEEPRKRPDGWSSRSPKKLLASVKVSRSENNYARFEVRYDHEDARRKHLIEAALSYSSPSLGYGCAAIYNMVTGEYQSFSNMARIRTALDMIFGSQDGDQEQS